MVDAIVIYDGPNPCQRCLGWKRVDDGEQQSWKYWEELPAQSRVAINLGMVKPITCPGHPITQSPDELQHIATFQPQPGLVFHLFEIL